MPGFLRSAPMLPCTPAMSGTKGVQDSRPHARGSAAASCTPARLFKAAAPARAQARPAAIRACLPCRGRAPDPRAGLKTAPYDGGQAGTDLAPSLPPQDDGRHSGQGALAWRPPGTAGPQGGARNACDRQAGPQKTGTRACTPSLPPPQAAGGAPQGGARARRAASAASPAGLNIYINTYTAGRRPR